MAAEEIKSALLAQLQDASFTFTKEDVDFLFLHQEELAVQIEQVQQQFEETMKTSAPLCVTIKNMVTANKQIAGMFMLGAMLTTISNHREFYSGLPTSDEVRKNGN